MPPKKTSTAAATSALSRFEEGFAKTFGEETLHRSSEINPYEVISTGSLLLDMATGVGGYVEGRLHEAWGIDAVGKTTIAILGLAEAQKKHPDKMVAIIDVERTFDKKWAATLGVDLERLYIYSPKTAEDVADAMQRMINEGLFSMIVLDSVAAMIPKKEAEKLAEEVVVGNQAKIITRMIKMNTVAAAENHVVVLMINQVRANIGAYGADKTTGGGWALKHGTTMKFNYRRTATPPYMIKENGKDIQVGHEIAVKLERNKVAASQRTAIFSLFTSASDKYGPIGVDRADEAANVGIESGVINHRGAWYDYGDEKFNGKDRVVEWLRANPEAVIDIRDHALKVRSGEVVLDAIARGELDEGEE